MADSDEDIYCNPQSNIFLQSKIVKKENKRIPKSTKRPLPVVGRKPKNPQSAGDELNGLFKEGIKKPSDLRKPFVPARNSGNAMIEKDFPTAQKPDVIVDFKCQLKPVQSPIKTETENQRLSQSATDQMDCDDRSFNQPPVPARRSEPKKPVGSITVGSEAFHGAITNDKGGNESEISAISQKEDSKVRRSLQPPSIAPRIPISTFPYDEVGSIAKSNNEYKTEEFLSDEEHVSEETGEIHADDVQVSEENEEIYVDDVLVSEGNKEIHADDVQVSDMANKEIVESEEIYTDDIPISGLEDNSMQNTNEDISSVAPMPISDDIYTDDNLTVDTEDIYCDDFADQSTDDVYIDGMEHHDRNTEQTGVPKQEAFTRTPIDDIGEYPSFKHVMAIRKDTPVEPPNFSYNIDEDGEEDIYEDADMVTQQPPVTSEEYRVELEGLDDEDIYDDMETYRINSNSQMTEPHSLEMVKPPAMTSSNRPSLDTLPPSLPGNLATPPPLLPVSAPPPPVQTLPKQKQKSRFLSDLFKKNKKKKGAEKKESLVAREAESVGSSSLQDEELYAEEDEIEIGEEEEEEEPIYEDQ